jgi:lipoprotein-releasing system permease protein
LPLPLHIAIRQLLARKRQALVIIGGVVLGVMVLLVTMSLFGGLLASFTSKILDVAPHVALTAESAHRAGHDLLVESRSGREAVVQLVRRSGKEERPLLRDYPTLLRRIEREYGDRLTAASPYLSTEALAAYGTNETTLAVKGVVPNREADLSDLSRYLLSGSVQRLEASRNGMLIGSRAAEDLGVKYGDRIRLVSLSGDLFSLKIVGVYHLGVEASDRSALVNLRLAQLLEHALPGQASGIGFHLRDVTDARAVADSIESLTGQRTETWDEANAGIISVFVILRLLFLIAVGLVIVICGFSIANILLTSVLEKEREIAVMKSFGLSARSITQVYLLQGLMIALAGSLLGAILGAAAIGLVGMIPNGGTGGVSPVEHETLQMEWNAWYFVLAIASTSVASILASALPARSAAKLVPVDILRGEQ